MKCCVTLRTMCLKVHMTEEARCAQRLLISKITEDPILEMCDGKKELKIVTDASLHAVAATLMQKEEDGKWYPVEFQSRSLDGNKLKRTYGRVQFGTQGFGVWG